MSVISLRNLQQLEILGSGKSPAYLFGVHPETYDLLMAPGQNIVAIMRAETGKQVAIVPDEKCAPTDVCVLIEGRQGVFGRAEP